LPKDQLGKQSNIPLLELIKRANDDVNAAGFFDFCLIFCLGGVLFVVATLDFDFDGLAVEEMSTQK